MCGREVRSNGVSKIFKSNSQLGFKNKEKDFVFY